MKKGDVFFHRRFIGLDSKPLRCVVTAVRQGRVYWKQESERKAYHFFRLSQADDYVLPNVIPV